ncbi:MAG: transposase, partial [Anaerolineales bacterium]
LNSMSVRTIERYQQIFRDNELAKAVMHDVTARLVQVLELNIAEQRLDSTHVFSNMATFGRTRLMGVTIKRFLTQVKRHDRQAYDSLPEELIERYRPSEHHLFGDTAKDKQSRQLLRRQVAEDLFALMTRFGDDERFSRRSTFKTLCAVFEQQCEVIEDKVEMKKKTGGDVIQNPSDTEATYDGHKGPGYQVQISETCSEENEEQLATSAIPQTACESDADALEPVREELKESELLPEKMLADTSYGSDENVQASAADGMELVSPVSGKAPDEDTMTIGDFQVDEATEEVKTCPAGHTPIKSEHNPDTGKTCTEMPPEVCTACPDNQRCPVKQTRNGCHFEHTAKQHRLDQRRRNEKTEEFRERYKKRAGIESTNSGIKRRTGMARLRVRGKKSMFHAILLKIAGWNIFQAARSEKMRQYVAEQMENQAPTDQNAEGAHATGTRQRLLRLLTAYAGLENALHIRNKAGSHHICDHRLSCAA